MSTSPELMNVPELAALLKVRVSTVYHWAQGGVLPFYRVGRLLRFRRTDIQDWISSRGIRAKPVSGKTAGSRADVEFPSVD